jgi:hypothetical protein
MGGDVLWVVYSLLPRQYGFLVSAFLFGGLAARNCWIWRPSSRSRAKDDAACTDDRELPQGTMKGGARPFGEPLPPDDGFTGYKAFVGDISLGARWGDYGMAVTVGKDIWVASEFIGQTCTLSQYLAAPIGSCGATRTALANWYTRISKITP